MYHCCYCCYRHDTTTSVLAIMAMFQLLKHGKISVAIAKQDKKEVDAIRLRGSGSGEDTNTEDIPEEQNEIETQNAINADEDFKE